MTFHQELVRFDAVVAEVVPEAVPSMGSGLNDEGITALRTVIAPMDLGEDIEQLYRWHDGSALSVFGVKRMLSAAEIIQDREFQRHALERPPAWLQFTDGPGYYFATLDAPGCETDPAVWSGDTHNVWLCRMHDSLESMIGSLNDPVSTPPYRFRSAGNSFSVACGLAATTGWSAVPDPSRSRIRHREPTSRCSMKERRSPGFVRWAHHRAPCCRSVRRRQSLNCARPHHEAKRPEQSRVARHMSPAPSPASASRSTMGPER
ncbi:hypothetical protein RCH11_000147 [Glaciihabitans sp. GrIS 2.15]|nr:hypothetical protein [Glaciihabitans sp. GrIS 2.15]